jgi:hypothetical protein
MDARIACASKPSRAVIGSGSSKSDYGSCTASTPNVPRDERDHKDDPPSRLPVIVKDSNRRYRKGA